VIFLTRNLSNQTEGIRLYDSTDTIISDNTISNPAIGIKISYSSKSYILRNHISECDFEAVQCSSGSNNDVCGNILTRNGMGITISDAYYYTIEDNIITHTTGTGIDLSWSSDNTINRNNISLNKNGIIVRQTSTQNIFRGNIIERNQQTGIILLTETGDNTMSKNMILGNTVGINNSGYQNTVINNNISLNAVGVIVGYSSIHNILKENIIGENHETGIIILTDAAFTTITENVIQKNRLGITILGDYNTIDHNRILDNFYGINISYGSYNIISCNNLLANKQHASFQILFKNRFNRWNNNYWNQSRILPQPILGRMSWRNPIISIPWLTFDWHPARKPYDIL
jgi:parallel beta-helix repeat protein